MPSKYIYCPEHSDKVLKESDVRIENPLPGKSGKCLAFYCEKCHKYYFNAGPEYHNKIVETILKEKNTGAKVYAIEARIYNGYFESKSNDQINNNNSQKKYKKKPKPAAYNNAKNSDNKSVRIHIFLPGGVSDRLKSSYEHLLIEYPAIGSINSINDSLETKINKLIKNVFPSKIDQQCVVRNASFLGNEGQIRRRAEIYNKSSNFLNNHLPNNVNLIFGGKLVSGELEIDEIRVLQDPELKTDDLVRKLVFYYDGPNKLNTLWDLTNNPATQQKVITGELADWRDYLSWKKRLSELRIQGLKYIGIRINVDERNMSFLVVSKNEEEFNKFRSVLRRNEVAAFSNFYSSDRWIFKFKKDDTEENRENGINLVFIDEGRKYTKKNIDESWNELKQFHRRYRDDQGTNGLSEIIAGINKKYPTPYYVELIFELTENARDVIERKMKRNGQLPSDLEESLAGEFYGDGFLATTQVGDFALIKRLTDALDRLARGKAASQKLDDWLFDISKARSPKGWDEISEWQNPNLNQKQKMAVTKILSSPDVCLIQGPPGTGKTTVIAEAIYQTVIRNKRVLISSQANLAVDNALERLISNPKIRAIRLGSEKKIDSSVDNITEEHVLQSFYDSVVEYVKTNYLSKWKEEDEIVTDCDKDLLEYNKLVGKLKGLRSACNKLDLQIKELKTDIDSDAKYQDIKDMKIEKTCLTMVKSYFDGASDDFELVLEGKTIETIWAGIYPLIIELNNLGIWLTRTGIKVDELDDTVKLARANDVLQNIFNNIRLALNIKEKIAGETEFGGGSRELELLNIREGKLREKVLNSAKPEDIKEWQEVSKQIKDLSIRTSSLTDNEKVLFGENDMERDLIVTDREKLSNILDSSSSVLDEIVKRSKDIIDSLLIQINSQKNDYDQKVNQIYEKIDNFESIKNERIKESIEAERQIEPLLKKYHATEKNIKQCIETRKDEANTGKIIDREDWEGIMTDFVKWIDDIPDYSQEKYIFLQTYINGCNVVGVSCTEKAKTLDDKGFDDFDMVIIDEVSKATPPEMLIPMLRGRKIVLVGDHRQLPPLFNEHEKTYLEVAQLQDAKNAELGNDGIQLSMDDFHKYKDMVTSSLFERYFENSDKDIKETLTYQYRMHKDIMNIVNLFYDGKLEDGNKDKHEENNKAHNLTIPTVSGTPMITPEKHAYWIDSSCLDESPIYEQRKTGSTSAENVLEAYTIIELLKKMEVEYANNRKDLNPVSVGVISFYYDQVSLIRQMVRKESFHELDIDVNTVDRFQGKEKEIIIVSLVRNVKNPRHNTNSHIAAFQRINVAFSRAQNLLIIVGAKDMYAPQPVVLTDMNDGNEKTEMVYKTIIEMMDMNGTLFYCDDIIPENVEDVIFEAIHKRGAAGK